MKNLILVADDEKRLVDLICDFLKKEGFETLSAFDGAEALKLFEKNQNDIALCIIDIMMPEIDGWELTKKIRKTSGVPIIMLSARSEDFDLLTGFEAGIDEYVTKPTSPTVLVKRVQALIKRSGAGSVLKEKQGLFLDAEAFCAYLDGKLLTLTLKEFELLLHFKQNAGIAISRDCLLDGIWGYDFDGEARTVDSHIARLRLKLGDYGVAHLKTVYGVGYKWEE